MVKKVQIEADALQVCMIHSFTTEKEEVMGLLVGEIVDNISHVHGVILLKRSDKRKDRVEISPEQLSNASNEAEKLGLLTREKKPMRIIGWYHSHPHITVWPSHVDVRTQAIYQLMDADFIGIIISCFNNDSSNIGKVEVTCFQSGNTSLDAIPQYERLDIDLEVIPCTEMSIACLKSLKNSPTLIMQEETECYANSLAYTDQDLLTTVQNAAVFTKSVMHIIEVVCAPILHHLELEVKKKKNTIDKLKLELEELRKECARL